MYYIFKKHHYYPGTYGRPKDQMVKRRFSDNPLTFASVKDAVAYLSDQGVTYKISAQCWSHAGLYHLRHGEYAPPIYKIRKKRTNTK